MLEDNMTRSRVLKAALRLIEEKGWRGLGVGEIAGAAGVTLADMHREFRTRTAILTAFIDEVDKEVLKKVKPADDGTPARDRIFEVLMTRLDVLKPHKGALRRLYGECRCAPPQPGGARLLCASANSHRWMLAAAGIPVRGAMGCLRVSGLMCAYGRVMPVWLRDDDPDQAKTMAALDRALSEGERWLRRLDALCCDIGKLACCFAPRRRRARRSSRVPDRGARPQIGLEDFLKVDIRVGTVVRAEPFPEARKPSLKLWIDFGQELGERKSSAQLRPHYRPEDLVGRQVAAVINFPPRQIGPMMSEVLTLGFPDENGEVVLFAPDRKVPDGGRLF